MNDISGYRFRDEAPPHTHAYLLPPLRRLLVETGFVQISFDRVGRIPSLAKSMIATARKPASS